MSDMLAMAERLERLRREVAELRARWDDYAAVSARAAQLGVMQSQSTILGAGVFAGWAAEQFGPSPLQEHMQSERFRLFGS